jgi:rhamnosyltransferase
LIVIAVVVSYHPDRRLADELAALGAQVARIVVVDNGSPNEELAVLVTLGQAEVIRLGKNIGIGAAHNLGIARAREFGATHVMLMDQDSLPQADMVQKLLAAEQVLSRRGEKVGAVGPVYDDPRLSKSWPFFRMSRFGVRGHECAGESYVACDFLISSGSLIPMRVIDAIGAMNEAYFLEHIDTEWSLRARFAGYSLYGVCDARMRHHLGDDTVAVPITGTRVQVYRPYRHYYLFRNSLLLWRERHAPLPWKLNEIKRLLSRMIFFPLFVAPRAERLRFMLLGLWHGILGRTGPLNA